MQAKIILVANQKGGAGKTTVAMQLGGFFAKSNFKTLVVDGDPQGSATRWASSASDSNQFPASVVGLSAAGDKIHREIKNFIDDYECIIIDTPPAAESNIARSALLVSDLCLVPVLPSPPDIWATVAIKEAIENAKVINEDLIARILVNQHQSNSTLSSGVMSVLDDFGVPLLETRLGHRVAFKESAAYGQTVIDFGSGKAKKSIEEMTNLFREVCDILNMEAKNEA